MLYVLSIYIYILSLSLSFNDLALCILTEYMLLHMEP